MKILKLIQHISMEFAQPIGEVSQKEVDDLLSDQGRALMKEEGLKEITAQAAMSGAKLLNFDIELDVVEI